MREDCCGTQEREGSAELLGLRRLIEQTYGLVYDGPDSGLLSHAIADRMQETGSECLASYCSSVLSSPAGADELRLLVDAATVKETRFFRGKGLFEALVSRIAPDIVSRMKPARQGGRSVRAWSAGCATGDEAYSLALVLMEAARGRFLSPVRVVGTDVSASALTHAAGGVYFANALRNVDKSLLKRYFIRLPADGGPLGCAKPGPWSVRYRVGPELAACVEFIEHNLAVMPYPQHLREFDLILCRNVLMYFSTDTVARVTRELSRCLCEGGYLILDSWTAPVDLESDECSMVQCGYGVVVRKTGRRRLRVQAGTSARGVARTQTSAPTHAPAQVGLSREAVAGVTRPPVPPIPEQAFSYGEQQHADCGQRSIEDRIEEAKAAADREDFEHALSLLDSLRQETPFDPRVHRLLGEIHLQLSDPRAASYSFARLLYLDPGNAAAHWRMADAAEQMGRHDVELRHLGNALKCLQNSASLEQLELPRDVLVKACLHRIERLRLKERT